MTAGRARIENVAFLGFIVATGFSIYQTLFCLWMLAHPLYASPEWKNLLVIRLLTTLALGCTIFFMAILRWRRKNGMNG